METLLQQAEQGEVLLITNVNSRPGWSVQAGEGGAVPQPVSLRALREKYPYLLRQQERVAAQIEWSRTDLR